MILFLKQRIVKLLVKLTNANTENEQIDVLSTFFELLEEFDISPTKQLVVDFKPVISIYSLTQN